MIGILIPLLLPVIVLQIVSFLPVFLFVPVYLAGSVISQNSGELAVSLAGLVGLLYYFMRS
jgi:uncharacterized protein YqfA (UPF0365 family)